MSEDTEELRLLGVSVTVKPGVDEDALAKTIQEVLRQSDRLGYWVEVGTVDVYEHRAHSGDSDD